MLKQLCVDTMRKNIKMKLGSQFFDDDLLLLQNMASNIP
jgi:hypothetical protein